MVDSVPEMMVRSLASQDPSILLDGKKEFVESYNSHVKNQSRNTYNAKSKRFSEKKGGYQELVQSNEHYNGAYNTAKPYRNVYQPHMNNI